MYYSYNFKDLEKCNREPDEYYTLKQLKENVPLTAHKKPFYPDNGWCIYKGYMSSLPFDCTSKEEAYELLLEAENIFEDVDDGYSQNAPCDNSGICAGSSCPYFWQCQN